MKKNWKKKGVGSKVGKRRVICAPYEGKSLITLVNNDFISNTIRHLFFGYNW